MRGRQTDRMASSPQMTRGTPQTATKMATVSVLEEGFQNQTSCTKSLKSGGHQENVQQQDEQNFQWSQSTTWSNATINYEGVAEITSFK